MAGGTETKSRAIGVLKVLFLLHLIFSAWGMQSASPFTAPTSYIYYNIIYMASLMWALASKTGLESVTLAFLVNLSIIVLDAITLSLYWPWGGSRGRIYFGFAIANGVLRPVTAMFLYQLFKDRDVDNVGWTGAFQDIVGPIGVIGNQGARQGYQNVDGNTPAATSSDQPAQPAQNPPSAGGRDRGYQAV